MSTVARAAATLLLLACGVLVSLDAVQHARRQADALADFFGPWSLALRLGALASLALSLAAAAIAARALYRRDLARLAALPLRVHLYALAAGAALELTLLQPPWKARHVHIAAALALGAIAALFLFGPALARRAPRRLLAAADVLLMNVCLAALGGEVALRVLARLRPSPILVQRDSPVGRILSNRIAPGAMRFGFPCNSGGHYDGEFHAKRPGEPLVVSIGDSFAAGVVPHPYHFTKVCERALPPGTAVFNMGCPSIGPPEYLLFLEKEALPLRPDLVVVDLFLGNDINDCHEESLERRLTDRENLSLYQVPRRLLALAAERRRREAEGRPALDAPAAAGRVADEDLPRVFPWVLDPLLEPPSISRPKFLEIEHDRVGMVCDHERDEDYPAFFRDLAALKRAAGATPLVFMLIPDEFQVEDGLWAEAAAGRGDVERDRPQREARAFLEKEGLPFLDLLPLFRAAPALADGRKHLYLLQDTHWNVRGNALAGEALAGFLRPLIEAIRRAARP
jgi:hypothetical protein